MDKIGFDSEKYLKIQSDKIKERIKMFDNKLYLEFGGKIFDDYHASRVLPGFKPKKSVDPEEEEERLRLEELQRKRKISMLEKNLKYLEKHAQ